MGYEYGFIHRPARMMRDVDALTRRFGKCVAAYLLQAGQMRNRDAVHRPAAYSADYFMQSPRPQRVIPTTTTVPQPLSPPRSESLVASLRASPSPSPIAYPTYYTSPLRYASVSSTVPLLPTAIPSHNSSTASHYSATLPQVWLSINATVSSVGHTIATWSGNILDHHMFEGSKHCALIAKFFFPDSTVALCSITQLLLRLRDITKNHTIKSSSADMQEDAIQSSCVRMNGVDRTSRHTAVPSCEDTAEIIDRNTRHTAVPSCEDTAGIVDRHTRHTAVPSCEDTAGIIDRNTRHTAVPSCEDTAGIIDRNTRHTAVPSCEDTAGIVDRHTRRDSMMFFPIIMQNTLVLIVHSLRLDSSNSYSRFSLR